MEHLWSPWRARHVASVPSEKRTGASIFEVIHERHTDDADYVLYRGSSCFALLNLYPYNTGHVLIVPNRRVETWLDLTDGEQAAMTQLMGNCMQWIEAALHPDGMNVGMNVGRAGGAGIPDHLHMHIVPRWSSDTNFMPVTADTKVLPESLRATYDKLKRVIP